MKGYPSLFGQLLKTVQKTATVLVAFVLVLQPFTPVFAAEEVSSSEESSNSSSESLDQSEELTVEEPAEEGEQKFFEEESGEDFGGMALMSVTADTYSPWDKTDGNKAQIVKDGNTGALVYAYPVQTPKTREAILDFPLQLTYNSQSQTDSIYGLGWSDSIPYIERNGKTGVENLYATSTGFKSSMSGELVLDGSYYYAKADNGDFLRYALSANVWTVTDKNGVIYTFGTSTASRQDDPGDASRIYKWMVSQVTTPNGNTITFSYAKDEGQIYPSSISYNTYGGGTPFNTIQFTKTLFTNTGSSINVPTRFNTGFGVKTNYLMTQIEVQEGGQWIRRYALAQGAGDAGFRRLLGSITESGRDLATSVTTTLPATAFSYKTFDTYDWQMASSTDWKAPMFFSEQGDESTFVQVVDVNYDSYPDFVRCEVDESEHAVMLNDADGTWTDTNAESATSTWHLPECLKDEGSTGYDNGVRFIDVNGDLAPDVVRALATFSGAYATSTSGVAVYLASTTPPTSSSQWVSTSTISVPIGFSSQAHKTLPTKIADVNGDGLADLLYSYYSPALGFDIDDVYVSNGYGWTIAPPGTWDIPAVLAEDMNIDLSAIEDLNDDGLADLILSHEGGSGVEQEVYINNGKTWVDSEDTFPWYEEYTVPVAIYDDSNPYYDNGARFADVNGDNVPDLVRSRTHLSTESSLHLNKLNTSFSVGWNSVSVDPFPDGFVAANGQDGYTRLIDINADGLQDFIRAEEGGGDEDWRESYLGQGEPYSDVLEEITTSDGGSISVDYKSSAQYKDGAVLANPKLPFKVSTVSAIVYNDGLASTTATTTYAYGDGQYYFNGPTDRKFAGFGEVIETDPVGNVTKTFFHQGQATSSSSLGEFEDHSAKIGKPYRIEEYDDSDNLFRLTVNKWDRANIATGRDFVKLASTTMLAYDGDGDHKDTGVSYIYDNANGNLTQKIDLGEVSGSTDGTFSDSGSDKFIEIHTYAANAGAYILGVLSQVTINDNVNTKVKETKYYYDGQTFGDILKGNPTKEERWVVSTTYQQFLKGFNAYGLVASSTDPRGKVTNYTYDTYTLFPQTVTDPLSHDTDYVYDYSSGQPSQITDPNNLTHSFVFDGLDRISAVLVPDPVSGTAATTTSYAYNDSTFPYSITQNNHLSSTTARTVITYRDGLGRNIQERKELEGSNVFAVRDSRYDSRGLLKSLSLPYESSGTARTTATTDNDLYTRYIYDALERPTEIGTVVGTTTNAYDQWVVTTEDPNSSEKEFVYDAWNKLVEVIEHNDSNEYETSYLWDSLGNLTRITDDAGNIRNFTYDGLSQRLSAQDLHDSGDGTFGTWYFSYDAAGNISSSTDPKGQNITYSYDDTNRVLAEDYAGQGGTEISYAYDSCTNGILKLCVATTTAAVASFTYNPAGLIAIESKKIGAATYTTTYAYDWQGNTTLLTYPDASEVRYTYNGAGLLESVEQKESGGSFAYIVSDFDYVPTDKTAFKEFGNGVTSTYTYDPNELYRLINILTVASSSEESLMGGGEGGELGFSEGAFLALAPSGFLALSTIDEEAFENVMDVIEGGTDPAIEDETLTGEAPIDNLLPIEELSVETPVEDVSEQPPVEEIVVPVEPEIATTTQPVEVPEKTFLLARTPGYSLGAEGRMKTIEAGTNMAGQQLFTTQLLQKDVQYQDALTGETKDINVALVDSGTAWIMEDAPFGVRLSKNSDGPLMTYRSQNAELYISPAVLKQSVTGEQVIDSSGEESVTYSDAFGSGVDIKVTLDTDSMRKDIVIESYEALSSLSERDGNIELPFSLTANEPLDVVISKQSLSELGSTTSSEAVELRGTSGHIAYFWAPVAVDAEGNATPITIEYSKTEKGIEFTKQIPVSWLKEAVFPVRTDVTVSYYADAGGDGELTRSNVVAWSTAHNDGSANTYSDTAGEMYIDSTHNGIRYTIRRGALPFDTSGLPDNAAIESATVSLKADAKDNGDNDGDDFIRIVQTTTASNTSLSASDYSQIGAVSNPTAGANDIDIGSINSSGWNTFTLNATGRSWINLTGYTKLGLREGHDAVDSAVANATQSRVRFKTGNSGGTTIDPVLEVTYHLNTSPSAPTSLQSETQTNPSFIEDSTPDFSAITQDSDSGDLAASYQIQVATSTGFTSFVWDSGKQTLASSTPAGMRTQELAYAGTALASTTNYYWRIKFWDDDNFEGTWSTETARFSLSAAAITSTDVIQDIDFDYDAVGNIVEITDTSKTMAAKTVVFDYDDLYRLTSASTTAATSTPFAETYTYSSIGNLTSKTGEGSYTYAETGYANPHAATAIGSTTLTYDNNGNVTAAGSWGYGWDYRNRLTSVGSGSATSTYGYDYFNQRVTKFVNSATSTYPNKYFNTNGTTTTKHIFAGDELVATITTTGATSSAQYIHADHLGSTNAVTNQDGDLYETIDYLPYGDERIHSGGFDEQRTFIQQEFDEESELSYLGARMYDGSSGHFLSQDPAVRAFAEQTLFTDPQQQNTYSYGRNNPIIFKDPNGELVELFSREATPTFFGMHMGYRLTPDNPNDSNLRLPNGAPQGSTEIILSAFPNSKGKLEKQFDYSPGEASENRSSDTLSYTRSDSVVLAAPNGMSDTEFINTFSTEYDKLQTGQGYSLLGTIPGTYTGNSNNFAYTLGEKVGVADQVTAFARQSYGITPGNGGTLPTQSLSQKVSNYFQKQINKIQKSINKLRSSK